MASKVSEQLVCSVELLILVLRLAETHFVRTFNEEHVSPSSIFKTKNLLRVAIFPALSNYGVINVFEKLPGSHPKSTYSFHLN